MTTPIEEALLRVRRVDIGIRDIMNFFFCQERTPEYIALPTVRLPKDFTVIRTNWEWESQRLCVIISHPSFPVVLPNEDIPRMDGHMMWWMHGLATEEELTRRRVEAATKPLDPE